MHEDGNIGKALSASVYRLVVSPVSSVHQVGQVQLTLLCERAEVFVMLDEIQQLGGVGHPEGERPGNGLLPLRVKHSSRVVLNSQQHLVSCFSLSSVHMEQK